MSADPAPSAAAVLPTTGPRTRTRPDARSYWRVLLALCAPVGWLTVGVVNAFMPYLLGGTTADNIAGIRAHPQRMAALIDVQVLFLFTFVPGVIALVVACRRAKPLFSAILGTLGILGALAGTFNAPLDLFIVTGLFQGMAPERLAAVIDALDDSALSWTLIFTLLFITVGRVAAGVLLWLSRVGPRALAVLMALSAVIEFGGEAVGAGNAAPATAWIASGIAMLGVTVALLRTPDDEFDLPAVPKP